MSTSVGRITIRIHRSPVGFWNVSIWRAAWPFTMSRFSVKVPVGCPALVAPGSLTAEGHFDVGPLVAIGRLNHDVAHGFDESGVSGEQAATIRPSRILAPAPRNA